MGGGNDLEKQGARLAEAISRILRTLNILQSEEVETALTVPQGRVCGLLREGPLPMTAISQELGISLSAVTQIADRLQRDGLVVRSCGRRDRRVRLLQLTEAGLQRVRQRHERRLRRAQAILASIPPEQREAALAALETLVAAMPTAATVDDDNA